MRSNLLVGISSAVAAVAVAGSASATIVPMASGTIDGFRGTFAGWTPTSYSDSTDGTTTPNTDYSNGTLGFNFRMLDVQGAQKTSGNYTSQKQLWATAQINDAPAGGDQVQALVRAGNANGASGMTTNYYDYLYCGFNYANVDVDGNAVAFDMTNAASFTVSFANNTFGTVGTNLRFTVQLADNPPLGDFVTYWEAQKSVTGSSGTVTFSAADFGTGAAAQWTNLGGVAVYVMWDTPSGVSAGTTLGTVTLTDFSYNAVPAPGAAALVGMAGLITVRRRRA